MQTPSTRPWQTATAMDAGKPTRLPLSGGWTTPLDFGVAVQRLLALPFDAMRFQYASAVRFGLAPRSLLASGARERALDALEKLVLGPLARQR